MRFSIQLFGSICYFKKNLFILRLVVYGCIIRLIVGDKKKFFISLCVKTLYITHFDYLMLDESVAIKDKKLRAMQDAVHESASCCIAFKGSLK